MPIQYTVLNRGMLIYACAHGKLTPDDLIEHERSILKNDRIQRGFKQLLDCRWVTADLIDRSVLTSLSQLHARHAAQVHGSRYAVVTHNAAWFEVGTHCAWADFGMTTIVFNDPSTACIWLGVDYGEISRLRQLDVPVATGARSSWLVDVSTA